MQRVATLVRRMPWIVVVGRFFWRLGRPKFSAGVVGVIFDAEGRVLLVEHVFHPYNPWGLPGGWVEWREHPAQTIRRELEEELGLIVEVGPVLLVEVQQSENHLDLAYLCYAQGIVTRLSNELLSHTWCNPAEVPKMYPFHLRAITQAQTYLKMTSQGKHP